MFERLKTLMTCDGMSEEFQVCWFKCFPPAEEDLIVKLLSSYPWLPEDYLTFLRTTNGAVLEMDVFYGLGDHPFAQVDFSFIVEPYGADRWITVGHDDCGIALAMNESGAIATIDSDPPPDEPVPLCDSFHILIEDICCGPRYLEYHGESRQESNWYQYIHQRGWTE